MCKKVLIAALAVVVALGVIKVAGGKGPCSVCSHIRLWFKQAGTAFEESIPPEQEIARLRMELKNLEGEDSKAYEQVARQSVDVENLQEKVNALKDHLKADETRIRSMKTSLTGESQFVTFEGRRESRTRLEERLLSAGARFEVDEARLNSMEEQLAAKKQVYDLNHEKLRTRKLERQKMLTELQRLETALVKERQVQAREENTLDDAGYQKIRKDMDKVRDRISVLKKMRELKGEANEEKAAAERREQERRKQYIEKRFGNSSGKAESE
jgi:chromosome segregation ATPase